MTAGQVSDLSGFVDVVETYELGGRTTAWMLALPIVLAEMVGGVGLLRRAGTIGRMAPTVALAVSLAWTVFGAQAFVPKIRRPV